MNLDDGIALSDLDEAWPGSTRATLMFGTLVTTAVTRTFAAERPPLRRMLAHDIPNILMLPP